MVSISNVGCLNNDKKNTNDRCMLVLTGVAYAPMISHKHK